jgi:hypothetical protein
MRREILLALFVLLVAGAFSIAGAQGAANSRIKMAQEVTPTWTAKGTMYGFVTCDRIQNQGAKVTVDDIKKCVAEGGKYTFGGRNVNITAAEQAKLAPFAGKYVAVGVTMTSARYGTGPTSDVAVEGLYSGGDRPATRVEMFEVVSVAIDPTPDPRTGEPQTGRGGGRGAAPAE